MKIADYKNLIPGFFKYYEMSKRSFILSIYEGCELPRKVDTSNSFCLLSPLANHNVAENMNQSQYISLTSDCSNIYSIVKEHDWSKSKMMNFLIFVINF